MGVWRLHASSPCEGLIKVVEKGMRLIDEIRFLMQLHSLQASSNNHNRVCKPKHIEIRCVKSLASHGT